MFNLFRSAFGASQTLSKQRESGKDRAGAAGAAAPATSPAAALAAPLELLTPEIANALQHAIAMLDGPLRARDKKGIYRVSGDKKLVDELAGALLLGKMVKPDAAGVVALAEAVKRCLRDLQPLIPYAYYDQFLRCVTFEGKGEGREKAEVDAADLRDLLFSIPRLNRGLLRSLLSHLRSVALNERVNSMGARNLALTCGLHLLRPASEDPLQLLRDSSRRQALLVHLIEQWNEGRREDEDEDEDEGEDNGEGGKAEEGRGGHVVLQDGVDYYDEERPSLAAPLSPAAAAAAAAAGARRRQREEEDRQGRRRGMRRTDRDRRAKSRGVRLDSGALQRSLGLGLGPGPGSGSGQHYPSPSDSELHDVARKHTADARDILQASLSPTLGASAIKAKGARSPSLISLTSGTV